MTTRIDLHGIPATPGPVSPAESDRAARWRRRQLLAAGYDEVSARRLAGDADVDVHALLTLIYLGATDVSHPDDPDRPDRSTGPGCGDRGLRS